MNEKVQAFLDAKRQEELVKKQAEKDKLLVDLGLAEKQYSPSDKLEDEYPYYDSKNYKYYKIHPIHLTDEEFEEIKRYAGKKANNASLSKIATINRIAAIFTVIAWITYIAGFFAGLAMIEVLEWFILLIWVAAFLSGTMYLGFAEMIKLLTQIRDK